MSCSQECRYHVSYGLGLRPSRIILTEWDAVDSNSESSYDEGLTDIPPVTALDSDGNDSHRDSLSREWFSEDRCSCI